ncbi:protein of unknown function [Azospirillum lipoferum 4B]|uniref:PqqD family protein n=1 Tax=Azospirillum lipoferum (strain 4B) TaxID=862719 RepID=G7Z7U9_AZOL4|nr:protein of unknown function [Azospirillum lipoferum 4B]
MPSTSLIDPVVYYRLSETIRNTLTWKSQRTVNSKIEASGRSQIILNNNLVFLRKQDGSYIAYNWDNHHYMEGDETLRNIIEEWRNPLQLDFGLANICQKYGMHEDDVRSYLAKMLKYHHLVIQQ